MPARARAHPIRWPSAPLAAALALVSLAACEGPVDATQRGDAMGGHGQAADAGSLVVGSGAGPTRVNGAVAAPGTFAVSLAAEGATTLCRGACVQLTASAEHGVAPYRYVFDQGLGLGPSHRVCPLQDTTYRVEATDASFDVEFGRRSEAASQTLTLHVSDCAVSGAEAGIDAGAPARDGAADVDTGVDASGDLLPGEARVLCAKPIATIDAWAGGSFDLWNQEFATKIATDKAGGARLAVTLTGSARMTNGPTLKSGDSLLRSLLVAKLDADCNPLWATLLRGAAEALDPIVAVDSQGRTIVFARTRSDGANEALYLASVSAEGTLLWDKIIPSATGRPYQRALRIDASDDIVIMSAAQAGSDFGGGPIGTAGSDGAEITVLAKYRASGDHAWSKQVQASATGCSLAVHNGTDIFLYGSSEAALDWGMAGRTSSARAGQGHAYLARADVHGSFVWSRAVAEGPTTPSDVVHSLDVLPTGRLLLGASDQLSMLELGGERVWSQQVVDPLVASPATWHETAVDAQGDIFLSGSFDDTTRIRGVTLIANERSVEAAFVQKVDALGRTRWTFLSDVALSDPSGFETLLGAVPDIQGSVFMLVNAFYAKKNALYLIKIAD